MLSPFNVEFNSRCVSGSLGDKGLFRCVNNYSPNSRCCPARCILTVVAIFLNNTSPFSSL